MDIDFSILLWHSWCHALLRSRRLRVFRPPQMSSLSLPVSLHHNQSAADNDQLRGIRFSTFWCHIYKLYKIYAIHFPATGSWGHLTTQPIKKSIPTSGTTMVCIFNTTINRPSRQTEYTSLPTWPAYPVLKGWLDNLRMSNFLVFCNQSLFPFMNWPLHCLEWLILLVS
jgi:hypothetical protein